jgi:succinate dehydrogenase cytochrome b subunit
MSTIARATDAADRRHGADAPSRRRAGFFGLFWSSLGQKYLMALTGVILIAYVVAHMVGNLKLYLGPESINRYGEWLREVGEPALPRTVLLWVVRVVLVAALVLHITAALVLTVRNRRARPIRYRSRRENVAATYASRTMRWSGVIVGLFILFHLADLTWGSANPGFIPGDAYHNVVASFRRWPVAVMYIGANLALALHLYHGGWSLFQSMGWSGRRFNKWPRYFAIALAALVAVGNVSFPVAVLTGIVS